MTDTHAHACRENAAEGVLAYAKLQAEIISEIQTSDVAVYPLATSNDLPDLLRQLLVTRTTSQLPNCTVSAVDLLPCCTTLPYMQQGSVELLSTLFSDLKQLAAAGTTHSDSHGSRSRRAQDLQLTKEENEAPTTAERTAVGVQLHSLHDAVGEDEFRSIMNFWKEDWLVD